jgi:outer membrane protein OmpA-like peptidoglycan-associated protein
MKILTGLLFTLWAPVLFAQKLEQVTVNFEYNKYDLTPAAMARLDSMAKALQSKTYTLELYGHCDSIGSNGYNDSLSQKRVATVKDYLTGKGFLPSLFTGERGMGKRQPVSNNATEEGRLMNRRVEVWVTVTEPVVETKVEKPVEKTIARIIEDTATKAGALITLRNLNFIGGRHYLLPASLPILDELLTAMNYNPKLVIAIEGHVCCVPDNEDGVDLDLGTRNLSEMRAKSVYDYLVKNGVSPDRLSYRGLGHSVPLAPYPEKTPGEMAANRRVEIKIMSK